MSTTTTLRRAPARALLLAFALSAGAAAQSTLVLAGDRALGLLADFALSSRRA